MIKNRQKLKLNKISIRFLIRKKNIYYNSIKVYNRLMDAIVELVKNKKLFHDNRKNI